MKFNKESKTLNELFNLPEEECEEVFSVVKDTLGGFGTKEGSNLYGVATALYETYPADEGKRLLSFLFLGLLTKAAEQVKAN